MVTPPRSAACAARIIASRASSSDRPASAPTGSGLASKARWTWVSTRPGSSVAPPRSMTSAPSGAATPESTATMVPPSITTSGSGIRAEPVPSNSPAARRAVSRPRSVNSRCRHAPTLAPGRPRRHPQKYSLPVLISCRRRSHSPLTLTICRSVCRTSTRSAASAMTTIDVLVGARDLVEERVGVPPLDPLHRRVELRAGEGPPRRRPAVLAARAVRRGVQRQLVPLAGHDVGPRCPSSPGSGPACPAGVDRALAGQPHVPGPALRRRLPVAAAGHRSSARCSCGGTGWSPPPGRPGP